MTCNKCKSNNEEGVKVCVFCQSSLDESVVEKSSTIDPDRDDLNPSKKIKGSKRAKVIKYVIIVSIVLYSGYVSIINYLNEDEFNLNDDTLESYDAGTADLGIVIQNLEAVAKDVVGNENKVEALKNLGYVYSTEGMMQEALIRFQQALALTDKDSFNYYLISGEIGVLEGDYNKALLNYNKAIDINPNSFQVHNGLGSLYIGLDDLTGEFADYDKALYHNQKAYDLDPNKSNNLKINIGLSYFLLAQLDEALVVFDELGYKSDPVISFYVGLMYAKKGDLSLAREHLQFAVDGGMEVPQFVTDFLQSEVVE